MQFPIPRMGDYYRRDRYDAETRHYSRDDSYRPSERGRGDRYQPSPPRPRSRERYQDQDRDDYYYSNRDRDRPRNTADDKDRYRDTRDDYTRSTREEPKERDWNPSEAEPMQHPSAPRLRDDPYDAGKPNSQVIFRGLEKEFTETDVYDFFTTLETNFSIVATISSQSRRCS